MRIDPAAVEEAAKELYIRALKLLPPDVKRGFQGLAARESDARAQGVLGVMIKNIAVAEATDQGSRLAEALNAPSLLVAAVGPVAAAAIESHGVMVDLRPEHPKMGHLVTALAARVGSLSGAS